MFMGDISAINSTLLQTLTTTTTFTAILFREEKKMDGAKRSLFTQHGITVNFTSRFYWDKSALKSLK